MAWRPSEPRGIHASLRRIFKSLADYLFEIEERIDAIEVLASGDVADHLADTADAHDATAISYGGGTGLSATTVEAALDELATEKADTTGVLVNGSTAGGVLAGTYPNPSFAADMATQAELDAVAAAAANASNLTSGTVADARVASTIARDSEVTAAVTAHEALADPHVGYLLQSDYDAIPAHVAAPVNPTGLTLYASFDSITATWDPNTEPDMLDGYGWYQVQVDDTSGAWGSIIFDLRAHGTAIIIPNLDFGQQYWVRVRGICAHGNAGAVWSTDDVTTIAINPEVIDVWALDAAQYIEGSGWDGGNSQDLTATMGWRLDAAGAQVNDAIIRGSLQTTDVGGAYVEVDGDSVEFFPSDIAGADLPAEITADTDNTLVIKPSDNILDQAEIWLAGESSSAYSGSAFHVIAKRHRLAKDNGGSQGLFTFPSTRGGAQLRTAVSLATSAAWTTCPVTAGGVILPTAVGASWDTTNDFWQAPAAWFEDATSGITVNVWAFVEVAANATGYRGTRIQKYSISGGTSIDTFTLDTDAGSAAYEYRGGGSVGLELSGTNQGLRLQIFQNSGGNRVCAWHWGIEYTGFF